jgi:nucleotide-binding universal stress UspA family protein
MTDPYGGAGRPVDARPFVVGVDGSPGAHAALEYALEEAVLVHLSRHADALIVGHRGRGGLASHLIGSVGLSCVVHAETTVVVVRG